MGRRNRRVDTAIVESPARASRWRARGIVKTYVSRILQLTWERSWRVATLSGCDWSSRLTAPLMEWTA
jgi:hypothetical protein